MEYNVSSFNDMRSRSRVHKRSPHDFAIEYIEATANWIKSTRMSDPVQAYPSGRDKPPVDLVPAAGGQLL